MVVQYRLDGRKVKEGARFRELHSRIAFSFIWVQKGRFAVTYSIDKQVKTKQKNYDNFLLLLLLDESWMNK